MMGVFLSRAASSAATAVDDDVTFCGCEVNHTISLRRPVGDTHNCRNSIVVSLGMLEQAQNIVTDDDAGLARQLLEDTHFLKTDAEMYETVLCTKELSATPSETVLRGIYTKTKNAKWSRASSAIKSRRQIPIRSPGHRKGGAESAQAAGL